MSRGVLGHNVSVTDRTGSPQYPTWMLRFNRVITSRSFTYLAAVLFVLDGIPRLFDGRVVRGIGNLLVASVLVLMRERTRRAALGESEPAEGRAKWVEDHPVAGAVFLGASWGAAMTLVILVTEEVPVLLALLLGLGSGLLLFGPGVVLLSRRYRRPNGIGRHR